jgi:hypothetical protein
VRGDMRFAVVFVVVAGLYSASFLSDSSASSLAGGVDDHSNHHSTLQPEAPLEHSSQDQDIAYSLFMHHSSGIAMLALGLLMLLDRLSFYPRDLVNILIGSMWLLFGLFLFIKSDPEGWPIGAAGFIESFRMPTASEWIQHKVLSVIPMLFGVYFILTRRLPPSNVWTYGAAGGALLGGIGLMVHQHADHPTFDIVNLQHRAFALNGFFIAGGLLAERWGQITWKLKPFFVPLGVMLIGLQLTLYVE